MYKRTLLLFFFQFSISANANCFKTFLKTYSHITHYKLIISKEENFKDLKINNKATLLLDHSKNKFIKLVFLDKGRSGLKNNNMILQYNYNNKIMITKGKSKGVLRFISKLAAPFIPSSIQLYSKLAVKNELFTVDRSGIDFIYKSLLVLQKSHYFYLIENDKICKVLYNPPHFFLTSKVKFQSIEKMEDKTGYPAFYLYYFNRSKFSSFSHFLNQSKFSKIVVPSIFFKSEIIIDKKINLPTSFTIFKNDSIIAKYIFKNIHIIQKTIQKE